MRLRAIICTSDEEAIQVANFKEKQIEEEQNSMINWVANPLSI